MKPNFASEAELAKVVTTWLRADGWATYHDVECRGGRADIVAVRRGLVWLVGAGNPLTCDPSYAKWVASLPSSPTGENGKAWCSDATRAALASAEQAMKPGRAR